MATALNAALMRFVAQPPAEGRTPRLFATVLMPADDVAGPPREPAAPEVTA
jgi:hypothetical protein